MFQQSEDYILRVLVPMFVAALAWLLQLKHLKKFTEASSYIDETAEKLLGMKSDVILRMPYAYLMAMLRDDTAEGSIKCLILAELLKEKAELFAVQGNSQDSDQCYLKSFNIFFEILFVKDNDFLHELFKPEDLQARFTSLAEVAHHVQGFQLPEDMAFKLLRYNEETGAFAEAEDILFEILSTTDDEAEVIDQGIRFFKRLRLKTDAQLEAGNLPREEVEAGLEELQDRLD